MPNTSLARVNADLDQKRKRRETLTQEQHRKTREHSELKDQVAQLVASGRAVSPDMRTRMRDLVGDLETVEGALHLLAEQIAEGEGQAKDLAAAARQAAYEKTQDAAIAQVAALDTAIRDFIVGTVQPGYARIEESTKAARQAAGVAGADYWTSRVAKAWGERPGLEAVLNVLREYPTGRPAPVSDAYPEHQPAADTRLAFR